jgi:invasion protein IalB
MMMNKSRNRLLSWSMVMALLLILMTHAGVPSAAASEQKNPSGTVSLQLLGITDFHG